MAFFLIVPSVIIVCIFLVHAIAERLNFKIKYSSLILCAMMSFAINFAAIELSTYLDKWHYIRLGVLILISAVIVTAINKFLVGRERNVIIVPAAANENNNESIEPTKSDEKAVALVETKRNDKIIEIKQAIKQSEIKKPDKPVEQQKSDIIIKNDKTTDSNVKLALPEKINKPVLNQPNKTDKLDKSNKIEKNEPVSPPNSKSVEKAIDKKMAPPTIKIIEESTDDNVKNVLLSDKKIEATDEIDTHLGSLDDILDYAYAEKTKGNVKQAILAYQRALDRYQNDDYAPFIAIDLGNIYKEQAAYTRFIKTYEEALKLPVVMRNSATYNEFAKTLAYMKMVQTVLARHRALTTPFSKIPAQYLQEAETEIKAAQMRTKYK